MHFNKIIILFLFLNYKGFSQNGIIAISNEVYQLKEIDSTSIEEYFIFTFEKNNQLYKVLSSVEEVCSNRCMEKLALNHFYTLYLKLNDYIKTKHGLIIPLYPHGLISDATGKGIQYNEHVYYSQNIINDYIFNCFPARARKP